MSQKLIDIASCISVYTQKSVNDIIDLFQLGILTETNALRFVIKNEYWHLLKTTDISTRSAIIHLSVKWDVSESTIINIIYKSPKIKA